MKIPMGFILIVLVAFSCQYLGKADYEVDDQFGICNEEYDSIITLVGIVSITTSDTILFERGDLRNEWQRKIQLIPCSVSLRDYMLKNYNSFLYLKNFDEKFWVSVYGRFIVQDSSESSPKFLYNNCGLLDETMVSPSFKEAIH
jgi:hypothetical protein